MFDLKSLEKNEKNEKNDAKKVDEDKKKSNDSFDDELDTMTKPVVLNDEVEGAAPEDEENNQEDLSKSTKSRFRAKDPCIEIRTKSEKLVFELTTGNIYSIFYSEYIIKHTI